MTNAINVFLNQIPYSDIIAGIKELKEREVTGILPRGVLCEIASYLSGFHHVSYGTALTIVERGILMRAACKFAGVEDQYA